MPPSKALFVGLDLAAQRKRVPLTISFGVGHSQEWEYWTQFGLDSIVDTLLIEQVTRVHNAVVQQLHHFFKLAYVLGPCESISSKECQDTLSSIIRLLVGGLQCI
jgi:hypothetical protein